MMPLWIAIITSIVGPCTVIVAGLLGRLIWKRMKDNTDRIGEIERKSKEREDAALAREAKCQQALMVLERERAEDYKQVIGANTVSNIELKAAVRENTRSNDRLAVAVSVSANPADVSKMLTMLDKRSLDNTPQPHPVLGG